MAACIFAEGETLLDGGLEYTSPKRLRILAAHSDRPPLRYTLAHFGPLCKRQMVCARADIFARAFYRQAGRCHKRHLPASKFRTDCGFAGSTCQVPASLLVLFTGDFPARVACFQDLCRSLAGWSRPSLIELRSPAECISNDADN